MELKLANDLLVSHIEKSFSSVPLSEREKALEGFAEGLPAPLPEALRQRIAHPAVFYGDLRFEGVFVTLLRFGNELLGYTIHEPSSWGREQAWELRPRSVAEALAEGAIRVRGMRFPVRWGSEAFLSAPAKLEEALRSFADEEGLAFPEESFIRPFSSFRLYATPSFRFLVTDEWPSGKGTPSSMSFVFFSPHSAFVVHLDDRKIHHPLVNLHIHLTWATKEDPLLRSRSAFWPLLDSALQEAEGLSLKALLMTIEGKVHLSSLGL